MKMRQVYSSSVRSIGHDPNTNELHVAWNNSNRVSIYSGVSSEEAEEIAKSHSVGKVVNALAKSREHRYG